MGLFSLFCVGSCGLPVESARRVRGATSRSRRIETPTDHAPGNSVRIFGELLVDPAPAVMAPPDLPGQQFSGDRSPGNDDLPEVPDLGPGGFWGQVQDSKPFLAFGMHPRSRSNEAAGRNIIARRLC